jgi:Tfp pilus assembly protein PilF
MENKIVPFLMYTILAENMCFASHWGITHHIGASRRESPITLGQVYGADDVILSVVYNNLAALMCELGNYEEAFSHLQRSLAIKQANLPEGHPGIANAHNNVADVLFNLGFTDEAEPRYQAALTIQIGAVGANHPDVATIRNNLAAVYDSLGRYADAEELLQQALTTDREMLNSIHPNLANDLSNLGYVQHKQGKLKEAEESYQESLKISEQVCVSFVLPRIQSSRVQRTRERCVWGHSGGVIHAVTFLHKKCDVQRCCLVSGHPCISQTLRVQLPEINWHGIVACTPENGHT